MIDIIINKTSEVLDIRIKGHANYAKHGTDIVCASVYTAAIMSANLIYILKLEENILEINTEEGLLRLVIKNDNSILKGIFENLEYTLGDICKQYPKNIKIKIGGN